LPHAKHRTIASIASTLKSASADRLATRRLLRKSAAKLAPATDTSYL
jgi:hypothetical protein